MFSIVKDPKDFKRLETMSAHDEYVREFRKSF